MWALVSFIIAFTIARIFTSLYSKTAWEISGFHIHHFWYGLAMLALGGWLGISVENERVNRVAAILFGAGGGLIVDEIGLLLTLRAQAYWEDFTYTFAVTFLALASILILLNRHKRMIRTEFTQFLLTNASLYVGVFLAAVSIAFTLETYNPIITILSTALTIVAIIIVLAYFIQRIRMRR